MDWKTALSPLLFVMLLTACSTEPSPPDSSAPLTIPEPPAQTRECPGLPTRPSWPYSQEEVADFVAHLAAAHSDCRAKLEALNNWLENLRGPL